MRARQESKTFGINHELWPELGASRVLQRAIIVNSRRRGRFAASLFREIRSQVTTGTHRAEQKTSESGTASWVFSDDSNDAAVWNPWEKTPCA